MAHIKLTIRDSKTITTVEELNDLPNGTILEDNDGDVFFLTASLVDEGVRPIHLMQTDDGHLLMNYEYRMEHLSELLPARVLVGAHLTISA